MRDFILLGKNMARFKLDVPLEVDYELIAIASALPNYRLAFFLNKSLGLDLVRKNDLRLDLVKKQVVAYFPKFYFYNPLDKIHFYLVNNLGAASSTRLIPELKQIDYLLLMKGESTDAWKDQIVKDVRAIHNVQTCFEVDPQQLYSKQNLIFDDETF